MCDDKIYVMASRVSSINEYAFEKNISRSKIISITSVRGLMGIRGNGSKMNVLFSAKQLKDYNECIMLAVYHGFTINKVDF